MPYTDVRCPHLLTVRVCTRSSGQSLQSKPTAKVARMEDLKIHHGSESPSTVITKMNHQIQAMHHILLSLQEGTFGQSTAVFIQSIRRCKHRLTTVSNLFRSRRVSTAGLALQCPECRCRSLWLQHQRNV